MIPRDVLKKEEGPKITTFFKIGMPNIDGSGNHDEEYGKFSYGGDVRKFTLL
jgi:hypothetical protein